MNIQPAQPIPTFSQRPDSDQAMIPINIGQLAQIAELFDIVDGFLRCGDGIAARLAEYLHATGRDQPQPPHGRHYTAGLLIDLVSLNADSLPIHRRDRLL